jgi:hypothetical protein
VREAAAGRADRVSSDVKVGQSVALIAWRHSLPDGDLVKGQRPPKAATLRAALDEITIGNSPASKRSKATVRSVSKVVDPRHRVYERERSRYSTAPTLP